MDEPFQSLDLPLRIQLMDLTLDLLEKERRIAVAATHDPREAIYLAGRTVVIAGRPVRSMLDEDVTLSQSERAYSSVAAAELEARIFASLSERSDI
jgi:NitT/TauT family transport system ATP-binding protein